MLILNIAVTLPNQIECPVSLPLPSLRVPYVYINIDFLIGACKNSAWLTTLGSVDPNYDKQCVTISRYIPQITNHHLD